VQQQLVQRFRSADPADIDAWFDQIYPDIERLVVTGQRAANSLTATYLVNHAATEGVLVTPTLVTPSTEQIATSLRVTGPVAFKTSIKATGSELAARRVMIQRVTGAGQRLILAGARDSIDETVHRSKTIVGWQRITSGSPCAFCAMLASRGAVYKSEDSAGSGGFHDHDSCSVEPVYSRDNTPSPFHAEWQQAKQLATRQGTRTDVAFRQIVEGRVPTEN